MSLDGWEVGEGHHMTQVGICNRYVSNAARSDRAVLNHSPKACTRGLVETFLEK